MVTIKEKQKQKASFPTIKRTALMKKKAGLTSKFILILLCLILSEDRTNIIYWTR
jgi:hypothetical protein